MLISAPFVFPVTSAPLSDHTLTVSGGVITEIRPTQPDDAITRNSCILPGFVNAHAHLVYTALRNLFDHLPFFDWIRKLTETKYQKWIDRDMELSTRLGIAESLRSGITTVAELADSEASLRALASSALRGIFYWEVFGVEKEKAEQSWSDLQNIYPRFCDQFSSSRLRIGASPHASYTVRPELYSRIAEWAANNSVPLSFHAAESRDEEDFFRERKGRIADFLKFRTADWKMLGSSSITHLKATGILDTKPLLAHVVHADETDMEILASYCVPVAHCPKSNAKFGHGIAPIFDLISRNVTVGIGTDSGCSNNRLDMFEECRFALLHQRARYGRFVLDEEQILRIATIEGAKALSLEQETGSLEVGKRADFIVLKIPSYYAHPRQVLNHIIHNATTADVLAVYVDGKEVNANDLDQEISDLHSRLHLPEV